MCSDESHLTDFKMLIFPGNPSWFSQKHITICVIEFRWPTCRTCTYCRYAHMAVVLQVMHHRYHVIGNPSLAFTMEYWLLCVLGCHGDGIRSACHLQLYVCVSQVCDVIGGASLSINVQIDLKKTHAESADVEKDPDGVFSVCSVESPPTRQPMSMPFSCDVIFLCRCTKTTI